MELIVESKKHGRQVVLIDAEYYYLIEKWGVYVWKNPRKGTVLYARFARGPYKDRGIHLQILPTKLQVDHINGSGLDNRRSNLREATTQQNCRNRKRKNGTSKYGGVCFKRKVVKGKAYEYWCSRIQISPKQRIHIGYFKSEVDAAKAYDEAALKHFGEFAKLNFPQENK